MMLQHRIEFRRMVLSNYACQTYPIPYFSAYQAVKNLFLLCYAFREEVSKSSYVRLHSSPVWHITDHDTDNTIQGG